MKTGNNILLPLDYFLDKYFLSFYTYTKKKQATEIIFKKHERRSFYPSIKSGIKIICIFCG